MGVLGNLSKPKGPQSIGSMSSQGSGPRVGTPSVKSLKSGVLGQLAKNDLERQAGQVVENEYKNNNSLLKQMAIARMQRQQKK